jgi:DNA invertase Pin-like site-specific DNA recombinase
MVASPTLMLAGEGYGHPSSSGNKSCGFFVKIAMKVTDSHSATAPGSGARVGYVRVSTVAQTLEQQKAALETAGVKKTFSDTMSGACDDRPGLTALLDYVREGDTVVVWKLDRLGRNTLHILETVKALTDRGVTLISTTDGIDSSTAAGRMMIGVLGSLAEYERELIKERTALKRAMSLANGTKFGRRKKVAHPSHIATAKRMKDDGHTARDIAKYLGVSRATLYRYLADEAA